MRLRRRTAPGVLVALTAVGLTACTSGGTPVATGTPSPRGIPGLETLAGEELREPQAAGLPQPSVDLAEIVSGGQPPDGIPALDAPRFQRTGDVRWVDDAEQVLVVEVGGQARAYPCPTW